MKESKEGSAYEDWRGEWQFEYLTSAFTPTLSEARRSSETCPVTEWPAFIEILARMEISLRTTVAKYVSVDELETLQELYRDDELLAVHRKVIDMMRLAAMDDISKRNDDAEYYALQARKIMLKHESMFPAFVSSDRYTLPGFDFGDGTVANML